MKETITNQIEVKTLNQSDVISNKKDICNFIYESVRMSNHEATYTMDQAMEKTLVLCDYMMQDQAIVLGAYVNEKMVGFLWAYKYPYREDLNRIYVSVVHVFKEYRRKKIGTRLIELVEEIAREKGVERFFLHAEANNIGACKFYENQGFIKERVQYVIDVDHSENGSIADAAFLVGGVKKADNDILNRYMHQFEHLYYENVKVHEYENSFSYSDAQRKINELNSYLAENKASLFYTGEDEIIKSFMWVHPIKYKELNRIYIHACTTRKEFRGQGEALKLYENLMRTPFAEKKIYTHVDFVNSTSCHIHEKMGFVPEVVQYMKIITDKKTVG